MPGPAQFHAVVRRAARAAALLGCVLLAGCTAAPAATTGATPAPSTEATTSTATPTPAGATPTAAPTPAHSASTDLAPGVPWVVHSTGGLRLIRPDGTGDHPVIPAAAAVGPQLHPDWSHDGARIAFAVDDADGTRDLWTVGIDGADPERLFDCADPCAWSDDPAWAPDDRSIAFQEGLGIGDGPDGVGLVQRIDVATGEITTLFRGGPTEYAYVPRWSPDGRQLIVEVERFASARLDEEATVAGTIGIIGAGGGQDPSAFEPLLPWESGAGYPDWHDDRIVFQKPGSGEASDIWLTDPDGAQPRRLTTLEDGGGRGLQPSWTPDGARVILVAEHTIGTPRAAFLDPETSTLTWLSETVPVTHPRLRP